LRRGLVPVDFLTNPALPWFRMDYALAMDTRAYFSSALSLSFSYRSPPTVSLTRTPSECRFFPVKISA
jgi:hypothetical protein